jgi:DNA-binding transcriptional LysR family regulator
MYIALLASGPYLSMRPASMMRFGVKHPSIKVLPVKLPALPRPVGIITLKGRMISPVMQLFIDCAREVAKPLASKK